MSFRRGVMVAAVMLTGALPATVHAQRGERAQRAQQPVSIKLLPPLYDQPLRFVLDQPAYVAAFIVSPGEGVRMIYPLTSSNETLQWAGFHNESLIGLHQDDDAYDVVFGRSAWSYASFGGAVVGGPRYLYVIASRWPLDVSRFVHRPSELQRTIGYDNARSFDSEDAFNGLLDRVVSLGSDDSWDSDVYMLWAPEWNDDGPHSFEDALRWNMATRVIACRDGSSRIVPMNYWFSGCPGDARLILTRPVKPYLQQLASGPESPTVLPSIKGVRTARRPEAKTEPTATGFLTTAAGGVSDDGVRVVDRGDQSSGVRTLTVVDEVPTVIVERGATRPESWRDHERRDHDHDHDRDRNRDRDHGWAGRSAGPVVGSTPQMAPAPRLAPNPSSAPAPRLAPAPNVTPERMSPPPRVERTEPVRSEPVRPASQPRATTPGTVQ